LLGVAAVVVVVMESNQLKMVALASYTLQSPTQEAAAARVVV
jgi:hypothetical protein